MFTFVNKNVHVYISSHTVHWLMLTDLYVVVKGN